MLVRPLAHSLGHSEHCKSWLLLCCMSWRILGNSRASISSPGKMDLLERWVRGKQQVSHSEQARLTFHDFHLVNCFFGAVFKGTSELQVPFLQSTNNNTHVSGLLGEWKIISENPWHEEQVGRCFGWMTGRMISTLILNGSNLNLAPEATAFFKGWNSVITSQHLSKRTLG